MIKRNIKMMVTPEESKQVQEICFANGIFWKANYKEYSHTDRKFLYIYDHLTWGSLGLSFKEHPNEEVDAPFFIKTHGSCVEEAKPKQYLCYVSGKALPKHIHKTLEQATQEAQRLCRKELTEVMVLEVVAEFEAEVVVREVL